MLYLYDYLLLFQLLFGIFDAFFHVLAEFLQKWNQSVDFLRIYIFQFFLSSIKEGDCKLGSSPHWVWLSKPLHKVLIVGKVSEQGTERHSNYHLNEVSNEHILRYFCKSSRFSRNWVLSISNCLIWSCLLKSIPGNRFIWKTKDWIDIAFTTK